MAAGKVEIGAFRTYPKDYKPPDQGPSEYQSIPLEKIEDFGVHCKQYYQLEISFFKSHRDTHLLEKIWSKYWMNTLAASPLITVSFWANPRIAPIIPLRLVIWQIRLNKQNRWVDPRFQSRRARIQL